MVGRSLEERIAIANKMFRGNKATGIGLSRFFKASGIKKKKIAMTYGLTAGEEASHKKKYLVVKAKIDDAVGASKRVVFCFEALYTNNTW